jgi:hypothetical protein
MKLRIDEVAEGLGLNLSQVQRQSGLTMTKLRRYWYNESRSAEFDALETLLRLFQRYDPTVTIADLFRLD